MTVGELKERLAEVPDDAIVVVQRVKIDIGSKYNRLEIEERPYRYARFGPSEVRAFILQRGARA